MPLKRASRFFSQDLWVTEVDEQSGVSGTAARTLRLFALALRGFIRDNGLQRASGLAFDSVLGLLPFLAILVSVLKGFGAYKLLMQETVRPAIVQTLQGLGDRPTDADVVTLKGAFLIALDLVDQAEFGAIGMVGVVLLLYVVALVLISVEESMNHVFGVEHARSIPRKISDFSAILFITPFSAMMAATVATAARSVEWLGGSFFLQLGAVVVMSFGLTMLYLVMPFTRVKFSSALFGGICGGILWYGLLAAQIQFQIGVARYNSLYSTFAAIPLFLVWVSLSWVVVLFGAELTAAHQNTRAFRWRVRGADADQAARAFVALRAMVEIIAAFVDGNAPRTLRYLSRTMQAPDQLVKEVLEVLVKRGLLARALRRGALAYVVARDIEQLTVHDVLTVLEQDANFHLAPPSAGTDSRVQALLDRLSDIRQSAASNLSLRELAALGLNEDGVPSQRPPSERLPPPG